MYENGDKKKFNFNFPTIKRKKNYKYNTYNNTTNDDERYIKITIPKEIIPRLLVIGLFFFMFIFCSSKFGTVVAKRSDEELFNTNITYIQNMVTKHYKIKKYSIKSGNTATKTLNELISDGIIEKDKIKNIDECDLNESYIKLTKNKDNSYNIIVSINCNGILEEKEEVLAKL